jgi:hypothetical protein
MVHRGLHEFVEALLGAQSVATVGTPATNVPNAATTLRNQLIAILANNNAYLTVVRTRRAF